MDQNWRPYHLSHVHQGQELLGQFNSVPVDVAYPPGIPGLAPPMNLSPLYPRAEIENWNGTRAAD